MTSKPRSCNNIMEEKITKTLPMEFPPTRLDIAVFELKFFPSRAQGKRAIERGFVLVNGAPAKPSTKVSAGDVIEAVFRQPVAEGPEPENIPLSIIYEDDDIVVIDKPVGMVVHPAAGNRTGTVVNAVLYHCRNLSGIGGVLRPGIVHRLDKETSGVLVIAKNNEAHLNLSDQFRNRTVQKNYLAVIIGRMPKPEGEIVSTIGRHPHHRIKMKANASVGREAVTYWKEIESYPGASLLEVHPRTGRTHQIRVHLSEMGHPVVGDKMYGTKKRARGIQNERVKYALLNMKRHALHAHKLTLEHPRKRETMTFVSDLPDDMRRLIEVLRNAS